MSIFFYIMGSLLAAAPLIAGMILKIRPPKNINGTYGFRTKLSASSKETWDYAQKVCADGLLIYSIPELLLWGAVLALSIIYLRGYAWLPFVIGFVSTSRMVQTSFFRYKIIIGNLKIFIVWHTNALTKQRNGMPMQCHADIKKRAVALSNSPLLLYSDLLFIRR